MVGIMLTDVSVAAGKGCTVEPRQRTIVAMLQSSATGGKRLDSSSKNHVGRMRRCHQ